MVFNSQSTSNLNTILNDHSLEPNEQNENRFSYIANEMLENTGRLQQLNVNIGNEETNIHNNEALMTDGSNNGMHNEIYGHFAHTTARYPESWVNSPQSNMSKFFPGQTSQRNDSSFSQYPLPGFGSMAPVQNSMNEALMMPPPSPNILSVYMYDHAINFPNRDFQTDFHFGNFYNPNQHMLVNPQYVLPPIQEAPPLIQQQHPKQFRQPMQSYSVYNQQQWGSRWGNGSVGSGYSRTNNGVNFNSQHNLGYASNQSIVQNSNQNAPQNMSQHLGQIMAQNVNQQIGQNMVVNMGQIINQNMGQNIGFRNSVPQSSLTHSGSGAFVQTHFVPNLAGLYSNPIPQLNQHPETVMVPGTNVPLKKAKTIARRDQILGYAHSLYLSSPHTPSLLPMLHTLNEIHPRHLPILLLLACVYYAQGNFQMSLNFHYSILEIDGSYVEAMSNIGTTLRTMGQDKDAEQWWWKAIKAKPTYWDAVENLLGLLTASKPTGTPPRYEDAYKLCSFVESHVMDSVPMLEFSLNITSRMPPEELSRFQNLLYTKANMMYAMGKIEEARKEYEKALQIIFCGQTLFDLISRIMGAYLPPAMVPSADELSRFDFSRTQNVLLPPNLCLQVSGYLFSGTGGLIPSINPSCISNVGAQNVYTNVCQTTSAIILTLAKIYQDVCINPHPLPLLLPLYYLSMSLFPSPSTCNNLGILLSNIPAPPPSSSNHPAPFTGTNLALQYYSYGLTLDPRHPHLYTNLGSLLKDMGNVGEAIRMYEKAVECNPKFDVALANLGNALKDSGRTQDSIPWYMRAVEINPDFTEAVCGLVNALGGVCDWRGRMSYNDPITNTFRIGWMDRIIQIVNKQLLAGAEWGRGSVFSLNSDAKKAFLIDIFRCFKGNDNASIWTKRATVWDKLTSASTPSLPNEGGWIIRSIEKAIRQIQRQWYWNFYQANSPHAKIEFSKLSAQDLELYKRPILPKLTLPPLPTVLPFHTFTYPLTPRQVRLISHRNALRISYSTLSSPWIPPTVYPPPQPPTERLKLGYVSSDFNNHPLAHLMQSVFGFHNLKLFDVYGYATTPADNSPYRAKIQNSTPNFLDVSGWSTQAIVERIVEDGIHILVNLNGYTKGARNEVFAARPAPILMSYMGFAGTLGGNWCDWFIADPVVCPPSMICSDQSLMREKVDNVNDQLSQVDAMDIDPEEVSESWVYTEKIIYLPHSYFVNDHRQGFRDPDDPNPNLERDPPHCLNRPKEELELTWLHEEDRRWRMRTELFPGLHPDTVIFANFNQLYKIDPAIFNVWLNVLSRVPNSVLWLLRFPAAGEAHLKRTAMEMAGPEVAARVIFTDVAPKHIHIHRGRIADIFFDTPECNAHTTAADILWSGTPIVTYARHLHKMCSRVAASIAYATGYGSYMVTDSEHEYADQAVKLALSLRYRYVEATDNEVVLSKLGISRSPFLPPETGVRKTRRLGTGELMELRKALFLTRDYSRLFDTPRWVRNLEQGYLEAWKRWERGLDDSPSTLVYDPPALKPFPNDSTFLKPSYINHLQEHLNANWSKGRREALTSCIWVNDDEDDLSRAGDVKGSVLSSLGLMSQIANPAIANNMPQPSPSFGIRRTINSAVPGIALSHKLEA